jgi:hypothetical protein
LSVAYHGGPLLQHVQVETIFYGPAWASDPVLNQQAQDLNRFLGFLATSSYMDLLGEYGVGRGQLVRTDVYAGGLPQVVDNVTHIQALINYEIGAGRVSPPAGNTLYFVFTPPGVAVSAAGTYSTRDFGGYHYYFQDYAGALAYYVVVPHPVGNYTYPGLDQFQQLTMVASHELAEAVTDPVFPGGGAAATGWYNDAKGYEGEIGDEAAGNYCVLNNYVVQQEWSNWANGPAAPAGATAFTGQPGNLVAVASAVTHSAESYAGFVNGAYRRYLGRDPEPAGLAFWVGQMQGGLTDERLEAIFIGAPEYIANHGGTGEAWVRGMYQDLLGRGPDDAGVSYWLDRLAAGARPTDIAFGFAASPEREALRVGEDYQTFLGRSPGQDEVNYWVGQFVRGANNETVVAGFMGSVEYYSNPSKGRSSPTAWLDSVYQDVLNRDPGAGEVNTWLMEMR